jgi:hypothetical protein
MEITCRKISQTKDNFYLCYRLSCVNYVVMLRHEKKYFFFTYHINLIFRYIALIADRHRSVRTWKKNCQGVDFARVGSKPTGFS